MADKNDDVKARMLAALEAKKNKKGAPGTQTHSENGSKIRGGQGRPFRFRFSRLNFFCSAFSSRD
jgi:hypothetical protein